ncbi:hypothetical protein FRB99_005986 [Tulasnella sp. 403]|nr:hypothetical protein FRB99_005986 [Tulasnella sp. 403]
MGVPAPEPPNEGVGSRHARVAILPSQIAQNILPEALTSESPVVETSTPRALPGANLERRGSVEDPLEYLRRYDTVVVVDDSSSMEGALWIEAREALSGIADVAARYDSDGIDIYFLNSRLVGKNMRNGTQVKRLFDRVEPRGITPTGEKLEELLLDYLLKLEAAKEAQHDGRTPTGIKPVNFLVITDGAATDDPAPVIAQAAKRLDEGRFPLSQVGVQFVQIGSDRAAAAALQELDDDLAAQHGTRDMVDTVPFSAIGSRLTTDIITKILLGGINRRQDKRQASSTNSNNPFMNNTLRS